jgi:hypothetical protein
MNLYYHFKVGLNIIFFWKQIFSFIPALIVPTIIGGLIEYFFDLFKLNNFIGFGIVYIAAFSTSMWFLGMNQYERDLIGKPAKKLLMRNR